MNAFLSLRNRKDRTKEKTNRKGKKKSNRKEKKKINEGKEINILSLILYPYYSYCSCVEMLENEKNIIFLNPLTKHLNIQNPKYKI